MCNKCSMQTPRLRLYTKNSTYLRMLQPADAAAIARTESLIAGYTGARHAILTSMGRMAIYEGLRALGVYGEIILSPITVPEVISLVHLAGFTPVFCDVAPGTWNMDPALAESLINEKTVAIMTTHFYGNMNTTPAIRTLCDKHGLKMIEDAAQAVGAWQGGKHAGTFGDFGILSFSYPKNVTSFYGGCLITDDDTLAGRVRDVIVAYPPPDARWLYKRIFTCALKDAGTSKPLFPLAAKIIRYGYKHDIRAIMDIVSQNLNPDFFEQLPPAYLSRMSPQQARAIADKWPEVDEDAGHRIRCAEIYHAELHDADGVILPVLPGDRSHTFLYFPIQVADKYALQRRMIERGCDVAVQHAPNCADLPTYRIYARDCPKARAACAGTLMLPTYRGFPLAQAEHYAKTIRSILDAGTL